MNVQLKETTMELIRILEFVREQFETVKTSGKEGDFYSEVKPFAERVKLLLDQWSSLAVNYIQLEKPTYLNENQLHTTYDHIEKISIQCFYPKTSRKIFLNSLRSAQFVLESVMLNLEGTLIKYK
ncbi:YppE family protein [Pseudoneobacillus sp. C159]